MEQVAIKAFPPQGVSLNTTLSHEALVPIVGTVFDSIFLSH